MISVPPNLQNLFRFGGLYVGSVMLCGSRYRKGLQSLAALERAVVPQLN